MSFSKAKIQRFNDVSECTPSPSKYNVSMQEKIKLGLISKASKSAKKNETPKSSDAGSVHSTPCFQTPTVPLKRKKLLGMSFKQPKSDLKLTTQEELREKIVECNNKDLYIKDLTEQIEEMSVNLNSLKTEFKRVQNEKKNCEELLVSLKQQNKEQIVKHAEEYNFVSNNIKDFQTHLKQIRQKYEDLKAQNLVDLSKLLDYILKFQDLYNRSVKESQEELDKKNQEIDIKNCEIKKYLEEINTLKIQHLMDIQHLQQKDELLQLQESKIQDLQQKEVDLTQEIEASKSKYSEEKKSYEQRINESEAKILLLEDSLKDVNLIKEIEMSNKIEEVENIWKQRLEEKIKESEAILKECQEISEYNIIECEVEKNHIKKNLEAKEQFYQELELKYIKLDEELNHLKNEKHAYELSIFTFRDTIEVLKKRLINSDRDVEQLKEELEKSEEKILNFERKCTELTEQLAEKQTANEELEMQYESTCKLMQNNVKEIEERLLEKVEALKKQIKILTQDRDLLKDVMEQNNEQQLLIKQAQDALASSSLLIENLEKQKHDLEVELEVYRGKLREESEEAAEIRKKYIDKSGKYDELAQQFEQILQELDTAKGRIEELERLIGPYQEQLESYQRELDLLNTEKSTISNEVKELSKKYAEILGHQNHAQKIKHVIDLKTKSSELFQKNIDLESKNYKLTALVEKLKKENEDLKKRSKKIRNGDEKENLASPKCLKVISSPGPLREVN